MHSLNVVQPKTCICQQNIIESNSHNYISFQLTVISLKISNVVASMQHALSHEKSLNAHEQKQVHTDNRSLLVEKKQHTTYTLWYYETVVLLEHDVLT